MLNMTISSSRCSWQEKSFRWGLLLNETKPRVTFVLPFSVSSTHQEDRHGKDSTFHVQWPAHGWHSIIFAGEAQARSPDATAEATFDSILSMVRRMIPSPRSWLNLSATMLQLAWFDSWSMVYGSVVYHKDCIYLQFLYDLYNKFTMFIFIIYIYIYIMHFL